MKDAQLRLCKPMDCSPPGSSVRGILQARILEWVAIPLVLAVHGLFVHQSPVPIASKFLWPSTELFGWSVFFWILPDRATSVLSGNFRGTQGPEFLRKSVRTDHEVKHQEAEPSCFPAHTQASLFKHIFPLPLLSRSTENSSIFVIESKPRVLINGVGVEILGEIEIIQHLKNSFSFSFGHAHVGSWFPHQGSNPHPLRWKHAFLTMGHKGSP